MRLLLNRNACAQIAAISLCTVKKPISRVKARTNGSSGLMSLLHAFFTSHFSKSFFASFLNLAFEVPIVLASQ
jgi:hypothetical protein